MKGLVVVLCIVCFCAVIGCNASQEEGGEPEQTNVLKEYVDAPKDRANAAKAKVEAAQDAVNRQAELLGE